MLNMVPSAEQMTALVGKPLYEIWTQLCALIEENYDMEHYAPEVQTIYDETPTYHYGKWLMFQPVNTALFADFLRLLAIKRKPNRTRSG